jgi:membrane protein implicated in regulation of membrane protease activity
MTYLFWFIASAVFIVCELLTTSLIFASFAFGALLAGFSGALGLSTLGQGITFAVASVLAVFLFRPILSKRFETRNAHSTTNVLALIGSTAVATEPVTASTGLVKVRGEVWSARTEGASVTVGQQVIIADIDGATLIVKTGSTN